jgi:type I restriction enzyme S subunit
MPVGWKAIQLARLKTKLTNGFVGPTRDILQEGGVRYLQSLHIKGGKIVFNTPYFVSERWSAAHAKSVLKKGDVLIVQTGDIGQVAAVTEEFEGCNCHALIIVCAKRRLVDGFFLSAVLRSHYGFHSLKQVQTGALHPHLNCTNIRDIFLPVPPLEEQRAILAFLDRETAKIDRLIKVRRKQVERLHEQRTAVIHHVVTKGLEPTARTKSSGHSWIEEMPEHWRVYRLKFVARLNPVKSTSGYEPTDRDKVVFLPMECVGADGTVDQSNRERVCDLWKGFTYFARGDVLVAKITPCFENGKGALVSLLETEIGFGTTELHVIRPGRKIVREFLYLITASYRFRGVGERFMTGAAGQQRIPEQFVADFPIALPPLDEQKAIVDFLHSETSKIDILADEYIRELELLSEYRASLISHAVTGKIDVRGLVPAENLERP